MKYFQVVPALVVGFVLQGCLFGGASEAEGDLEWELDQYDDEYGWVGRFDYLRDASAHAISMEQRDEGPGWLLGGRLDDAREEFLEDLEPLFDEALRDGRVASAAAYGAMMVGVSPWDSQSASLLDWAGRSAGCDVPTLVRARAVVAKAILSTTFFVRGEIDGRDPYEYMSDYRDALLGGLIEIAHLKIEESDPDFMARLEAAIVDSGGESFDVVLGEYVVGEQTTGQVVGGEAAPQPELKARQRVWDDKNDGYLLPIHDLSGQMGALMWGTGTAQETQYTEHVRIMLDDHGEPVWVEWKEEIVSDVPYTGEVIILPEDQDEYDRLTAEYTAIYERRDREIGPRPVATQVTMLDVKAANVTRLIKMQQGDRIISQGQVPMRMQIEAKYDFYEWAVPRDCAVSFRETAVQWLAAYKWSRYHDLVEGVRSSWTADEAESEEYWAKYLLGAEVLDDF